MKFRQILAFAVMACITFAGVIDHAVAAGKSRVQYYEFTGAQPGEKEPSYHGTLKITFRDSRLDLKWTYDDKSTTKGTGIAYQNGDAQTVVATNFEYNNGSGIGIFVLNKDGSLSGAWAVGDETSLGWEAWVPIADPAQR